MGLDPTTHHIYFNLTPDLPLKFPILFSTLAPIPIFATLSLRSSYATNSNQLQFILDHNQHSCNYYHLQIKGKTAISGFDAAANALVYSFHELFSKDSVTACWKAMKIASVVLNNLPVDPCTLTVSCLSSLLELYLSRTLKRRTLLQSRDKT